MRSSARESGSRASVCLRAYRTIRSSFRAESSSASRSRARSPESRRCSWPTSLPAISTARPANFLLGGDLMVSADRPLLPDYAREAHSLGLATVPVIRFNSMVQGASSGDAVLADVKAVGAGYPLRGAVVLAKPGLADGQPAQGVPGRGEAWIDTRLSARLGLAEGGRITVGEAS